MSGIFRLKKDRKYSSITSKCIMTPQLTLSKTWVYFPKCLTILLNKIQHKNSKNAIHQEQIDLNNMPINLTRHSIPTLSGRCLLVINASETLHVNTETMTTMNITFTLCCLCLHVIV